MNHASLKSLLLAAVALPTLACTHSPPVDFAYVRAVPLQEARLVAGQGYLSPEACSQLCGLPKSEVREGRLRCFRAEVTGRSAVETTGVVCNGFTPGGYGIKDPFPKWNLVNTRQGRVPEGLEDAPAFVASSDVAASFARMQFLEAASVRAFQRLASDLARLGAPPELSRSARSAAEDEKRHARAARALARRYGGARSHAPRIARVASRGLEAVALENAVEGCVHETFAAALAWWQAREASDPEVRDALSVIAEDETRHAELAWDVHAWAASKLGRDALARVKEAQRLAFASLENAGDLAPPHVARVVGLPSGEGARRIARALASALTC